MSTHELALAALYNARDMLGEAEFLLTSNRPARALSLGVLAAEELTKAVLYRCIAVGIISELRLRKDLTSHELKLFHFTHITVGTYMVSKILNDLIAAVKHDVEIADHSQHIYPNVLLMFSQRVLTEGTEEARQFTVITLMLKDAHARRLRSLYVDVKGEMISEPRTAIDLNEAEQLIRLITKQYVSIEGLLLSNDGVFKSGVKYLIPYLLESG